MKGRDINHNFLSAIRIAASSGAKILTCQSCKSSFLQLGHLQDHMAEVHGLQADCDVQHEYFGSSDTD